MNTHRWTLAMALGSVLILLGPTVAAQADAIDDTLSGLGPPGENETTNAADQASTNAARTAGLPNAAGPGPDAQRHGGGAIASLGGAGLGPAWLVPLAGLAAVGGAGLWLTSRRRGAEPGRGTYGRRKRRAVDHPGVPGMLLLGQEALDQGAVATALAWFECALTIEPGQPHAQLCRALCLEELDDLYQALVALQRLTQDDTGCQAAQYARARVLVALGRTGEALDALEALDQDRRETALRALSDPDLAPLHDHPRLRALAGRL